MQGRKGDPLDIAIASKKITFVKQIYQSLIQSPGKQLYQTALDRNLLKLWSLEVNVHCYLNQPEMTMLRV